MKFTTSTMDHGSEKARIALGMKVSVRRSNQNRIGVVTRLEGQYVVVRWTNSDLGETAEYHAHRDDVTPLAGWF
jgi:hypothetical protein